MTGTGSWALRDVTLVDGTGAAAKPHHTIVITGGTIDWIGPTEHEPDPLPARVVEAAGLTVVPGLINSHVHLANDGAADLEAQVRATRCLSPRSERPATPATPSSRGSRPSGTAAPPTGRH